MAGDKTDLIVQRFFFEIICLVVK